MHIQSTHVRLHLRVFQIGLCDETDERRVSRLYEPVVFTRQTYRESRCDEPLVSHVEVRMTAAKRHCRSLHMESQGSLVKAKRRCIHSEWMTRLIEEAL